MCLPQPQYVTPQTHQSGWKVTEFFRNPSQVLQTEVSFFFFSMCCFKTRLCTNKLSVTSLLVLKEIKMNGFRNKSNVL